MKAEKLKKLDDESSLTGKSSRTGTVYEEEEKRPVDDESSITGKSTGSAFGVDEESLVGKTKKKGSEEEDDDPSVTELLLDGNDPLKRLRKKNYDKMALKFIKWNKFFDFEVKIYGRRLT